MREFKVTKDLIDHLDSNPQDWEELDKLVQEAKEKVLGKPLKTSQDLLNLLLREGKRECTYHYDDGKFVIWDLSKWDKICKRVKEESL